MKLHRTDLSPPAAEVLERAAEAGRHLGELGHDLLETAGGLAELAGSLAAAAGERTGELADRFGDLVDDAADRLSDVGGAVGDTAGELVPSLSIGARWLGGRRWLVALVALTVVGAVVVGVRRARRTRLDTTISGPERLASSPTVDSRRAAT
jgi:hypothetical protein